MAVDLSTGTSTRGSSLVERLRGIQVGLRRDLEVSRHRFRGEATYIFRDPVTFQSHAFGADDYRVLAALGEDRTLDEVFRELVAAGRLDESSEEQFYAFVVSLHRQSMLALPLSDAQASYRRFEQRRSDARRRLWLAPLFLRIPLVNPDAFLVRTAKMVRWLFTPAAFAAWLLLMGVCAWVAHTRWDDLVADAGRVFSGQHLLWVWVALVALKILHEFGHAYACRGFGGPVPEMGIYLVALTPCAYMDASSSWGFPSTRRRIVVALGGVYFESLAGAIALAVWSLADPGPARSVAVIVMMLSFVSTVAFNLNPLLRYDGYFILSDLLQMPNLRRRAAGYALALLRRVALGLPIEGAPAGAWPKLALASYGMASTLYRMLMVLGIATFLALRVPLLGWSVALVFVLGTMASVLGRLVRYLWTSPQTAPVRLRAALVSLLVIGGVPALASLLPMSGTLRVEGVARPVRVTDLVAKSDAVVTAVERSRGDAVDADTIVVELANPDVVGEVVRSEAAQRSASVRFADAGIDDPERAPARAARLAHRAASSKAARTARDSLSVRSPLKGTVLDGLTDLDLGRTVQVGETLAVVASEGLEIRIPLDQGEAEAIGPARGGVVECRAPGNPSQPLAGVVAAVVGIDRAGTDGDESSPAAGPAPRVFEVVVSLPDPPPAWLRSGMAVEVRLPRRAETIGTLVKRSVLRFRDALAVASE